MINASALATVAARLSHMTTLKPLTQQQKEFIFANRIFLPRNLQRVSNQSTKKLGVRREQVTPVYDEFILGEDR